MKREILAMNEERVHNNTTYKLIQYELTTEASLNDLANEGFSGLPLPVKEIVRQLPKRMAPHLSINLMTMFQTLQHTATAITTGAHAMNALQISCNTHWHALKMTCYVLNEFGRPQRNTIVDRTLRGSLMSSVVHTRRVYHHILSRKYLLIAPQVEVTNGTNIVYSSINMVLVMGFFRRELCRLETAEAVYGSDDVLVKDVRSYISAIGHHARLWGVLDKKNDGEIMSRFFIHKFGYKY